MLLTGLLPHSCTSLEKYWIMTSKAVRIKLEPWTCQQEIQHTINFNLITEVAQFGFVSCKERMEIPENTVFSKSVAKIFTQGPGDL